MSMHALEYHWDLEDRFNAEALRGRVAERGPLFDDLPGLRAKAFLIDEGRRRFGGFYLWESAADAERFLASDLFASSCASLGTPEVRRYEVPGIVGPAGEAIDLAPRRLSLNHVMVYVRDVPRALEFYEAKLGFRRIESYGDGYARLESPGGGTTMALHRAEPERDRGSDGIRLYFEVDDLEAFCERLAARGVAFLEPPKQMPWGWRHAYLEDPDGHEISIYRAGAARFRPTSA